MRQLSEQEDLIVWMRTAALPTFKKLYGKIETGNIEVNDEVMLVIENNYNTYEFGGRKSIVLSTTTWVGGRNNFLGMAYILIGGISLLLAAAFLLLYVMQPRWGTTTYSHLLYMVLLILWLKTVFGLPLKSSQTVSESKVINSYFSLNVHENVYLFNPTLNQTYTNKLAMIFSSRLVFLLLLTWFKLQCLSNLWHWQIDDDIALLLYNMQATWGSIILVLEQKSRKSKMIGFHLLNWIV